MIAARGQAPMCSHLRRTLQPRHRPWMNRCHVCAPQRWRHNEPTFCLRVVVCVVGRCGLNVVLRILGGVQTHRPNVDAPGYHGEKLCVLPWMQSYEVQIRGRVQGADRMGEGGGAHAPRRGFLQWSSRSCTRPALGRVCRNCSRTHRHEPGRVNSVGGTLT